jgi:protein TonB
LVLSLFLLARDPVAQIEAETPTLFALFPSSPQQQQSVVLVPQLVSIHLPPLVIPEIQLPPSDDASVTAITVLATPQSLTEGKGEVQSPLLRQEVDYIRWPQLRYPAAAKRRLAQGIVYVAVLVGVDGKPQKAWVHTSSGNSDLDRAAEAAVFTALFKPRVINGVPLAVHVIVPIQFTLSLASQLP